MHYPATQEILKVAADELRASVCSKSHGDAQVSKESPEKAMVAAVMSHPHSTTKGPSESTST